MSRIRYEDWKPGPEALGTLAQAHQIASDYQAQGYDLTLRQLYYQFVARDLIPNTQRSYKRLGDVVNRGRMAGLLDWDFIVDRTRNLRSLAHWEAPEDIVAEAARQFRVDKWATQPTRVEVWVEKDALAGVVGQVADRNDVSYFACRGYVSQSELWGAAQRLLGYVEKGQRVVVLHLGDHDPSGIDMTRDIGDRLLTFTTQDFLNAHSDLWTETTVKNGDIWAEMKKMAGLAADGWTDAIVVDRIALNMDQVEEYDPPPNPAKMTDSRVEGYLAQYGDESWELDALDPATLDALIDSHIEELRDDEAWDAAIDEEEAHSATLEAVHANWDRVKALFEETPEEDLEP